MEKKTIGGFIAALRKANGMTQKDLAERAEASENADETTPKAEKQRQRLLKSTLTQYTNCSYIAMGVSAVGVIVALICNLAFLKAVLGFFLGMLFFAASIVCQAIFVNRAFLSVEDAGLDEEMLSGYKRKVICLAQKSIGLTIAFIGFCAPMLLVGANLGLEAGSMLAWGAVGAAVCLLIYAVVLYFFNAALIKRGTYTLSGEELSAYQHNHKLKRSCAIVLIALLAVMFVAEQLTTSIWIAEPFFRSRYAPGKT